MTVTLDSEYFSQETLRGASWDCKRVLSTFVHSSGFGVFACCFFPQVRRPETPEGVIADVPRTLTGCDSRYHCVKPSSEWL
jgi:hypothetical protein